MLKVLYFKNVVVIWNVKINGIEWVWHPIGVSNSVLFKLFESQTQASGALLQWCTKIKSKCTNQKWTHTHTCKHYQQMVT